MLHRITFALYAAGVLSLLRRLLTTVTVLAWYAGWFTVGAMLCLAGLKIGQEGAELIELLL